MKRPEHTTSISVRIERFRRRIDGGAVMGLRGRVVDETGTDLHVVAVEFTVSDAEREAMSSPDFRDYVSALHADMWRRLGALLGEEYQRQRHSRDGWYFR